MKKLAKDGSMAKGGSSTLQISLNVDFSKVDFSKFDNMNTDFPNVDLPNAPYPNSISRMTVITNNYNK